jgi:acetyl esterase
MDGPPAGGATLDPELAALLESGRFTDLPPWHEMGIEAARRVEDEIFSAGEGPAVDSVTDRHIDGPGGDLPIRVYRPESGVERADEPLPAIVFCHGGGWVMGTLDSADDVCRALAAGVGAVVVSVDYRLAPEHPFPAAVDDAWAALKWVTERTAELGVDRSRVAVAGTSSGGGLAAAVGLRARDENVCLAAQVLCYPMVDSDLDRPSFGEARERAILTAADVAWFWDLYLAAPSDAENPLAAPMRADSLAGCPPSIVATAGHDVLRSEGVAFADRLEASGAPTTHCHFPSLTHGFCSLAGDVEEAQRAVDEVTEAVRKHLDWTDT